MEFWGHAVLLDRTREKPWKAQIKEAGKPKKLHIQIGEEIRVEVWI
ncbi:MAG: hypothetical protein ABDH20_12045 [Thermus sp.]